MVEMFLLWYLPHKALVRPSEVDVVPDVLCAWVRFVLGKRGLPEQLVAEAVGAVRAYTPEYLEAVRDPANHGPAKAALQAMRDEGVDHK